MIADAPPTDGTLLLDEARLLLARGETAGALFLLGAAALDLEGRAALAEGLDDPGPLADAPALFAEACSERDRLADRPLSVTDDTLAVVRDYGVAWRAVSWMTEAGASALARAATTGRGARLLRYLARPEYAFVGDAAIDEARAQRAAFPASARTALRLAAALNHAGDEAAVLVADARAAAGEAPVDEEAALLEAIFPVATALPAAELAVAVRAGDPAAVAAAAERLVAHAPADADRAGDACAAVGDAARAAAFYRAWLADGANDGGKRHEVYLALARALAAANGPREELLEALRRAVREAEAHGEEAAAAVTALFAEDAAFHPLADDPRFRALCASSREELRLADERDLRYVLELLKTSISFENRGETPTALLLAEAAVAHADWLPAGTVGFVDVAVEALARVARNRLFLGAPDYEAPLARALTLAETPECPPEIAAFAHAQAAIVAEATGDLAGAVEGHRRALALREACGSRDVVSSLVALAGAEMALGAPDDALEALLARADARISAALEADPAVPKDALAAHDSGVNVGIRYAILHLRRGRAAAAIAPLARATAHLEAPIAYGVSPVVPLVEALHPVVAEAYRQALAANEADVAEAALQLADRIEALVANTG